MSTAAGEHRPAITFIRVPSFPTDRTPAYEEWYDRTHLPVRVSMPGFLAAQRYETLVGRQRYFVVYELADAAAVETDEYLSQRVWESQQPDGTFEAPGTKRPGFERGLYDQESGPGWPVPELRAPVLHIVGHLSQERMTDSAALAWLRTDLRRAVAETPGVVAVRQFRLTGHHFGGAASQTQLLGSRPAFLTMSYVRDFGVVEDLGVAIGAATAEAPEAVVRDEGYLMVGRLAHTVSGSVPLSSHHALGRAGKEQEE